MEPAPTIVSFAGYTVLRTGADGSVVDGREGLYDYDTRILSRYRLTLDGQSPQLLGQAQPESDRCFARYRLPREGGNADGPLLPQDAVEVELDRVVGGGLLEHWTVHNRSAVAWSGVFELEVDGDFADLAEVARERRQTGTLTRRPSDASLELAYEARHGQKVFARAVRVEIIEDSQARAEVHEHGLRVPLDLEPRGSARIAIRVSSQVDGRWRAPDLDGTPGADLATRRATWRERRLRIEAADRLGEPFDRAVEDLFALRNEDLEGDLLDGHRGWILNAGVPNFTGFFGRDTLTSGWQSAMAGTRALRGALEVAARTQASEDDPWRDAEPGKMLHELRRGPLSVLGLSPRDAYYGSQTTPTLFVTALSELWHWTGDDEVLRRYREPAIRALDWAERASHSGTGFMTYQRRSPAGLRNQGWKDSNEAIRHADGRIAPTPLATVEEQAFYVLALQRMGEMLLALDEDDLAAEYLARGTDLQRRWHEAFWMPREGYYALALDADGDQVTSITSNPGHALAAGIVPATHALRVADRLLSPELFNGWGVRTLAEDHPSYNPLAYHLGTVWPVENATFALGLKRYGLDDHLERLACAVIEAAASSPDNRLPEVLTGHRRRPGVGPTPYPDACVPQAWSASAVVQLVQVMLGLYPFAPLRILALVRPRLPAWLPEVTLRNVRVGRATVDLRFERRADGSADHRVVSRRGSLLVLEAGPPADANGDRPRIERLRLAALERAPGRLARAARIAIGLEAPPSTTGDVDTPELVLR